MWRYVFFILLLVAVAPLLPKFIDGWLTETPQEDQDIAVFDSVDEDDVGRGTKRFEIPKAANGQYLTEARLNGRTVTMLVDTGASHIVLPEDVARRIGIFLQPSDFKRPVQTANGIAKTATATLRELRLGPIRLKNVEILVLEDGLLAVPLLGMSALGRLKRFDISDETLILVQ